MDESRFSVSGWEDDLNDINEEKYPHETPQKEILWAAENGKLDDIKDLLARDPKLVNEVDSDGYTPLHRACYGNFVDIVDYLLVKGADVSHKTQTQWQPLHSCCHWNNKECAIRLIQNGADVNATSEGETPQKEILWAAENGKLDDIKDLLARDPKLVNEVDSDGYTPLHRACYGNFVDIVDYLLVKGADVSHKTQTQWQPLHSCCHWNNKECAIRLIQNGADVNATSEGDQTPLHIAATHGAQYDTVQFLLMDPYINPEIKNKNGETAYDIAKRSSKYYPMFEMVDSIVQGISDI